MCAYGEVLTPHHNGLCPLSRRRHPVKIGINKAIVIGNVGRDAEIRVTPNGDQVGTFSLATSESWKDSKSGESREETSWHRIVVWKGLAEIASKFALKGAQLYVEGKMITRKYKDGSGVDRSVTEIVADDIQVLKFAKSADDRSSEASQ